MNGLRGVLKAPVRAWRRSLAFRFVVSALVVQAVLLSLTGAWLVQQTVEGLTALGAAPTDEARSILTRAVAQRILIFLPLSAVAMYVISVQVIRPLAAARSTAQALASGDLASRMAVTGSEDTAALARALNHMAEELSGRLRELEEVSLIQQQFVSDVAHELRTPLTTVRMAADVIYEARAEFSPVSARSAELLSREVDRFESLLNDLLDLSRMDAGAAVLAAEETDLAQLVRDEVASQQQLANAYGSALVVDAPKSCLARVDAMRVRRILVNLLTNAIEHGEGRPVEVRLRHSGGVVAVAVRDHGVGLSEEEQEQAFTRFWRADPSRLRTVGGAGLGLPIALENALLHGGSLDVWGRPGEGAQFRVLLPVEPGGPLDSEPWPLVPPEVGDGARP
nr:HAMP domain-containing histidine kinase [Propionibacterium sp.]